MRIILICILFHLMPVNSAAAELHELGKELLTRDRPSNRDVIIEVCDNHKDWCNGYFISVIHHLKANDIEVCLPSNEVGRHIDESVWVTIKAWLYRQKKTSKIKFYDVVRSALTEHKNCK